MNTYKVVATCAIVVLVALLVLAFIKGEGCPNGTKFSHMMPIWNGKSMQMYPVYVCKP